MQERSAEVQAALNRAVLIHYWARAIQRQQARTRPNSLQHLLKCDGMQIKLQRRGCCTSVNPTRQHRAVPAIVFSSGPFKMRGYDFVTCFEQSCELHHKYIHPSQTLRKYSRYNLPNFMWQNFNSYPFVVLFHQLNNWKMFQVFMKRIKGEKSFYYVLFCLLYFPRPHVSHGVAFCWSIYFWEFPTPQN